MVQATDQLFLDHFSQLAGECVTAIGALTGGTHTSCSRLAPENSKDSSLTANVDHDLLEILNGCMESQDDVHELAACLTETEDELKAVTDDVSFLQFPAILQEAFPPESSSNGSIAPSVSSEYLRPKGPATVPECVTDFQAISCHPLLPLVSRILRTQTINFHGTNNCLSDPSMPSSCGCLIDNAERGLEFNAEPSSEIDRIMAHAVSLSTHLSEDKSVETLMQSIDNECSYFTGEMSLFCQTLLETDTASTLNDKDGLTSKSSSLNSKTSNSEKGKKSQLKGKVQAPKRKRTCLSYRNTQILRGWLLEHADNPFPTDSEKDILCLRTGLSLAKLNEWFINSRRRILGPLGLRNYHKEVTELSKK